MAAIKRRPENFSTRIESPLSMKRPLHQARQTEPFEWPQLVVANSDKTSIALSAPQRQEDPPSSPLAVLLWVEFAGGEPFDVAHGWLHPFRARNS